MKRYLDLIENFFDGFEQFTLSLLYYMNETTDYGYYMNETMDPFFLVTIVSIDWNTLFYEVLLIIVPWSTVILHIVV